MFVRRARRMRSIKRIAQAFVVAVAFAGVIGIAWLVFVALCYWLASSGEWDRPRSEALTTLGVLSAPVALAGGGLGAVLIGRDWALIWTIRDRLVTMVCPVCGQSLVGLPCADGESVRCPECGESHRLAALGIAAEDLRPKAAAGAGSRDG